MTNKTEYNSRHKFAKDRSHSKADIAKINKIPLKTIKEVYNRGVGAHGTNPASVRVKGTFKKDAKKPLGQKLSKEQWGMARVYSFANKLEGRRPLNHDKDLV